MWIAFLMLVILSLKMRLGFPNKVKNINLIHENASAKESLRAQRSQQILKHQKYQDIWKENLAQVNLQHHRQIVEGKLLRLRNVQTVGKNKKLK